MTWKERSPPVWGRRTSETVNGFGGSIDNPDTILTASPNQPGRPWVISRVARDLGLTHRHATLVCTLASIGGGAA